MGSASLRVTKGAGSTGVFARGLLTLKAGCPSQVAQVGRGNGSRQDRVLDQFPRSLACSSFRLVAYAKLTFRFSRLALAPDPSGTPSRRRPGRFD